MEVQDEDFKLLKAKINEIYNSLIVIDYFCSNQQEIEELANLTPIIKNLRKAADKINAFFINYQKESLG